MLEAQDGHGDGYYAFLSAEVALQVFEDGNAFNQSLIESKRLVLCRGRGYGQPICYSNGKRAFSRLVVDEIVSAIE